MTRSVQTSRQLRTTTEEIGRRLLGFLHDHRRLDTPTLQQVAMLENARSAVFRLLAAAPTATLD